VSTKAPGSHRRAASPVTLLATKLSAPARRRDLVPRTGLLRLVAAAPLPKLVLVGAPPGSGKTTFLSEWCESGWEDRERSFAWLSLDPADNDPARFWAYTVEALSRAAPSVTPSTARLADAPGAGVVESLLPALINDLTGERGQVVLVLDDLHVIDNPEIHAQIEFLIDHLPPTARLVVATRSDPPLPLPRLRARRELIEIRIDALRFNDTEATALLKETLGFDLAAADVARLRERTEGWAAGLYLAALSLRDRPDPAAFIREFAGDDRNVVDYLGAEVIDRQPEPLREFLLRTSILERLCGPLCDAVTDGDDSQERLVEMERSNLFVVALDTKREWYRYHHLFGELLRFELKRTEPGLVQELHRRAFRWFRDQGSVPEAIEHATAAGEVEEAADLITEHWSAFLQRGRLETVSGWIDALPGDAVRSDPRLCLTRAWIGVNTGRLDEVSRWIEAAEQASAGEDAERAGSFEAAAGMLRCIERYMEGDVGEAIESARRALELERIESSPWRSVGCPVLGISLFWSGHAGDARATLEDAMQRARPAGNNLAVIHALGCLATMAAERGELELAAEWAARASQMWGEHDLGEHWATTMTRLARGKVLERRGRLDDASTEIRRGVDLASSGVASIEIAYSLLTLAQVESALGDRDSARGLVEQARRVVDECSDPGILETMLTRAEHRLRARTRGAESNELTDRELGVLQLLAGDQTVREIGASLYVSRNTVKTHTKSIFRKLSVSNRAEAVARARELGLVDGNPEQVAV
jgi:LuxR family transcriptional regulator, maltose regulon positive regulatory protein